MSDDLEANLDRLRLLLDDENYDGWVDVPQAVARHLYGMSAFAARRHRVYFGNTCQIQADTLSCNGPGKLGGGFTVRIDDMRAAVRAAAREAGIARSEADGHTERLRRAIVAAGRPIAGSGATPEACVDAVRELVSRSCSRWAGPGGRCSTCGVMAYFHPDPPAPARRGCAAFVITGAGRPIEPNWCEFCLLPYRDHRLAGLPIVRRDDPPPSQRRSPAASWGNGLAWSDAPQECEWRVSSAAPSLATLSGHRSEVLAAACERARLFIGTLECLPLADERAGCELRYHLRKPSEGILRKAVSFLAGAHPPRPGQAELVRDLQVTLALADLEVFKNSCIPEPGARRNF